MISGRGIYVIYMGSFRIFMDSTRPLKLKIRIPLDQMPERRKFSEEEVQELLRQGLELQEESLSKDRRDNDGLSLDEVKKIADEVGIDPSFIALAAQKSHKKKDIEIEKGLFGSAKTISLFREVEGELDSGKIEEIVNHFRASLGKRGILQSIDDKFEWKSSDGKKPDYVLKAETHKGFTDIKLTFRPNKADGFGEMVPAFIPLIFPLFALFSGAPFGVIIPFTLFATLMSVMAFSSTKKQFQNRELKGSQKMERLLSISESVIGRGVEKKEPEEESQSRIDQSLLDDSGEKYQKSKDSKGRRRNVR